MDVLADPVSLCGGHHPGCGLGSLVVSGALAGAALWLMVRACALAESALWR